MTDQQYAVSVLRALAYLFSHPEIESGIMWTEPVNHPEGRRVIHIDVDDGTLWRTHAALERRFGKPAMGASLRNKREPLPPQPRR